MRKQCRKEYTDDTDYTRNALVILRNDTYDNRLSWFNEMFAAAQADFPFLKEEDVRVVIFGGDRIKGIMGIEFQLPRGTKVPDFYEELYALPPHK